MLDAFRVAAEYPQGATAVSLPIDIMTVGRKSCHPGLSRHGLRPAATYGPSPASSLREAAALISAAKAPVLYLGMRATEPETTAAVHAFLRKHPIPVVETFQAAGSIPKELAHLFYGRLGLFRNQPGDKLITHADLLITVGYDQSEYDADAWNQSKRCNILHLDVNKADYGYCYAPKVELVGSMGANLDILGDTLTSVAMLQETEPAKSIFTELHAWVSSPHAFAKETGPTHPLHFIRKLQELVDPTTTVISDVGSVYIWLCRFFYSYVPKTFLMSNAQQTLGVGLPWAIGAALSQTPEPCARKVVSISGDGGFLFSAQELVTAVKLECDITHFIWNDGKYNMVEFQEVDKYGRSAGVDLGGVDFVKYAESMGARGLKVSSSAELEGVMEVALSYKGVCVVDITIDYSQNHELMMHLVSDKIA